MKFLNHQYQMGSLSAAALGICMITLSLISTASLAANEPSIAKAADIFTVVEKVKQNKLLDNLKKCPIDHAPQKPKLFQTNDRVYQRCIADLPVCYQHCSEDQPYSCYFLAQTLQGNGAIYEADQLFQRSCELGVASGCTNRAASMKNMLSNPSAEQQACFTRTFKQSCDWEDPWGCTMYAYQLVDNLGVAKAEKKALKVLEGSCKNGEDDPACEAAQNFKEYIKNHAVKP